MLRSRKKNAFPVIKYQQCLAKTYRSADGSLMPGRNVYEHCLIVGSVAKYLIGHFPEYLRKVLFPEGSSLVAACHDTGKLSPTFYLRLQIALNSTSSSQVQSLLSTLGFSSGATAAEIGHFEQARWGGHAGAGAIALEDISGSSHIGVIVGQHHGCRSVTSFYSADSEVLGGKEWQSERRALVEALQRVLNEPWPAITRSDFALRQLLAGLTSVSDWIGSNSLFDDPALSWQNQLPLALKVAGIATPRFIPNLEFGEIFKDEMGCPYSPNESQLSLYEAVVGPGVYVLEAPMGLGKTEAALYAAYKVLAAGQARGIYFALPTQLTSDKIHQRFTTYLQAILVSGSNHHQALLLHGKSHLQEQEMGEEGRPGGHWFSSRKRGLLAPFAVGTLDQALMAAMNVTHGFVRAFGLAGKVVILDEVHSYDAFTSLIMQKLVEMLRELHCTVIILSATLTQSRRAALLSEPDYDCDAYPVISAQSRVSSDVLSLPLCPPESKKVLLQCVPHESTIALEEALLRAEQGQQVLWIENTVSDAQARYFDFAARCAEMDIACGLLHSRFTQRDRAVIEDSWVGLYGKGGWGQRVQTGRILVGTQVLEQSIDIDADFLVTRFAPTDLLMQRLGRLWRHAKTPRPDDARCEAWILAPDLKSAIVSPEREFGASALVYSPYILCRSLEVWQGCSAVSLPKDIRLMLEATYAPRDEPAPMNQWKHELFNGRKVWPVRKGINELEQLARLTLSGESQTLPESRAQTRYSEQDNGSFLLLRGVTRDEKARITRLQLRCGEWLEIPWRRSQLDEALWRKYSLRLESERVSLRSAQYPDAVEGEWIWDCGLQHLFYAGNTAKDEDRELRVAVVGVEGDLRGIDGEFRSSRYRYSYRDDTGLRIMKKE
ncbi:CRISPR-associated helicase Cas3' [Entomohabitans teleogrylli]|uniref:CRISPR-associated helicase Cas3' n=1 Tax=Entomohabitans teleogrylli TaxID=1384589 RepID=UPI00073D8DCF|nr:CRISPR-associated helicase Cas3' [Entomohabitans teleogrylli]